MRTVWTLRKEQDLSISEISEQLKTSEQTIKNQLSTVTKRLKSFLTKVQLFLLL
ncbi:Sigma-70, region 4 [compost metagenome]